MRARVSEWAKTERGKSLAKKNRKKYRQSEKGRESERAYSSLPRVKAAAAVRTGHYLRTQTGKYNQFNRFLKRLYGIDAEDWARMFNAQDCGCACCGEDLLRRDSRYVHLDHCHTSGRVRAILCRPCNITVGSSEENPLRLEQAAAYVRKYASR